MIRPAISWLCKLTNFKNEIEIAIEINAYAQTKSESTNGITSCLILSEFKASYLEAKVSIEPILIIKNEIMANPTNSINEMTTKITDILIIKDVSFFDIIELMDLINVNICKF